MEAIEIVLIILGIAVVVASFVISEKIGDKPQAPMNPAVEIDTVALEESAKEVLAKIKNHIRDLAEEAMDETEKELGKVSVEKNKEMQAECAGILEEIEKSHKEVLFLYGLLDEKKSELENSCQSVASVQESHTDAVARLEEEMNKANELIEDLLAARDVAMEMDKQIRIARNVVTELQTAQEASVLEREAREKASLEWAEQERISKERFEMEEAAREKAEADRVAWEKAEEERRIREKEEWERLEAERAAREQEAKERVEAERLAWEKEMEARAEAERIAREKAEEERIAREKAEAERLEAERLAKEQEEAAKAEAERLAKEQEEAAKAEAERLAKEQEEAAKAEAERLAKEQEEAEATIVEEEKSVEKIALVPKKIRGRRSAKGRSLMERTESILREDENNNNRKILAMHRDGKSELEIAKSLSLGIGEVRLVIDLFKGAE